MKPLKQKAYGSIPHLRGSRVTPGDHYCEQGQQTIVTEKSRDRKDLVIVQEKLDGSNVAVAKVNGEILALIRAGYLAETSPYDQHHYFSLWVNKQKKRFESLLGEGERIVGEWLMQAHGTKYNLPHEPFVVFDIMKGHNRLPYHDFLLRVLPFGFTIPSLLHIGQPIKIKEVKKILKAKGSAHGAIDEVEGFVYRCERDGKVDFLAKWVHPNKQDGCYLPEISNLETVWNTLPERLLENFNLLKLGGSKNPLPIMSVEEKVTQLLNQNSIAEALNLLLLMSHSLFQKEVKHLLQRWGATELKTDETEISKFRSAITMLLNDAPGKEGRNVGTITLN